MCWTFRGLWNQRKPPAWWWQQADTCTCPCFRSGKGENIGRVWSLILNAGVPCAAPFDLLESVLSNERGAEEVGRRSGPSLLIRRIEKGGREGGRMGSGKKGPTVGSFSWNESGLSFAGFSKVLVLLWKNMHDTVVWGSLFGVKTPAFDIAEDSMQVQTLRLQS